MFHLGAIPRDRACVRAGTMKATTMTLAHVCTPSISLNAAAPECLQSVARQTMNSSL